MESLEQAQRIDYINFFKHLLPGLKSSYLTTLLFSYAYYQRQGFCIIRMLSKQGDIFIKKNMQQLKYFTMQEGIDLYEFT